MVVVGQHMAGTRVGIGVAGIEVVGIRTGVVLAAVASVEESSFHRRALRNVS